MDVVELRRELELLADRGLGDTERFGNLTLAHPGRDHGPERENTSQACDVLVASGAAILGKQGHKPNLSRRVGAATGGGRAEVHSHADGRSWQRHLGIVATIPEAVAAGIAERTSPHVKVADFVVELEREITELNRRGLGWRRKPARDDEMLLVRRLVNGELIDGCRAVCC